MDMEFWGVEVKAGEKLRCTPEFGKLIHISQAAMGEVKDKNVAKGSKNTPLRMTVDDEEYIIGFLSVGERPQVMFDLVLEREFELSHDLKNASVYYIGYVANDPVSDDEVYSDFDDEDEELPIEPQENGKGEVAVDAKPKKENKVAKKEKIVSSDDNSEADSEFSDDGEVSLDEMSLSDSDGSDDSSEEEGVEVIPEANQSSKKRQAAAAVKTPLVAKKAKSITPEPKGKKAQNATPSPSKNSVGKSEKTKTPKSGALSHSKSKNGRK